MPKLLGKARMVELICLKTSCGSDEKEEFCSRLKVRFLIKAELSSAFSCAKIENI